MEWNFWISLPRATHILVSVKGPRLKLLLLFAYGENKIPLYLSLPHCPPKHANSTHPRNLSHGHTWFMPPFIKNKFTRTLASEGRPRTLRGGRSHWNCRGRTLNPYQTSWLPGPCRHAPCPWPVSGPGLPRALWKLELSEDSPPPGDPLLSPLLFFSPWFLTLLGPTHHFPFSCGQSSYLQNVFLHLQREAYSWIKSLAFCVWREPLPGAQLLSDPCHPASACISEFPLRE